MMKTSATKLWIICLQAGLLALLCSAEAVASVAPVTVDTNYRARCPNSAAVLGPLRFPPQALKKRLEQGSVVVAFGIAPDGAVHDIRIISSTDPSFDEVALGAVRQFRCVGNERKTDETIQWPFDFKAE